MTPGPRDAHGVTLVELIVVLALLGVITGIATLGLESAAAPRETDALRVLRRARAEAIHTGRPVQAESGALFLPDGRAIGAGVDPLTGVPHAR